MTDYDHALRAELLEIQRLLATGEGLDFASAYFTRQDLERAGLTHADVPLLSIIDGARVVLPLPEQALIVEEEAHILGAIPTTEESL